MSTSGNVLVASLLAHGALALGVAVLRPEAGAREIVAISVSESKPRDEDKPKAPELPRPADEAPAAPRQARAKTAPAAPKDAPPPEAKPASDAPAGGALDALPDFGVSLTGGVGGPGGLAVPAGGAADTRRPAAEPRTVTRAPQTLAPVKAPLDECAEPVVKPKPRSVPQPAYTASARDAAIEGRVRVEVTVDATGKVSSARVLAGLGYGLDEAALASARAASFEPATRCGKPAAATFVIAMRFSL